MDFKLELGLSDGTLLLADEISLTPAAGPPQQQRRRPDLDKDRFRKDLGGVMEAYGGPQTGPRHLPEPRCL